MGSKMLICIFAFLAAACSSMEDIAREAGAGWEVQEAVGAAEEAMSGSENGDQPGGVDHSEESAAGVRYGWPWIEVEVPLHKLGPVIEKVLSQEGYAEDWYDKSADWARYWATSRDNTDFQIKVKVKEISFEKACSIKVWNEDSNRVVCRELLDAIVKELGVVPTRSGYER